MLARLFSRSRFPHQHTVSTPTGDLLVSWTAAAEQALAQRARPLIVEMQLYFSCNIKKLVYFHDSFDAVDPVMVNDRLQVCFRPIKAQVCDPVEFARSYPVDYQMDSPAARRMGSKRLQLDFRDGEWEGRFMLVP